MQALLLIVTLCLVTLARDQESLLEKGREAENSCAAITDDSGVLHEYATAS